MTDLVAKLLTLSDADEHHQLYNHQLEGMLADGSRVRPSLSGFFLSILSYRVPKLRGDRS